MTPEEQRLVAEMKSKLGEVLSRMDPITNAMRGPIPAPPKRKLVPADAKRVAEQLRQRGNEVYGLLLFCQLIEITKREFAP